MQCRKPTLSIPRIAFPIHSAPLLNVTSLLIKKKKMVYLASSGLSCDIQVLLCTIWRLSLWCVDSLVVLGVQVQQLWRVGSRIHGLQ